MLKACLDRVTLNLDDEGRPASIDRQDKVTSKLMAYKLTDVQIQVTLSINRLEADLAVRDVLTLDQLRADTLLLANAQLWVTDELINKHVVFTCRGESYREVKFVLQLGLLCPVIDLDGLSTLCHLD